MACNGIAVHVTSYACKSKSSGLWQLRSELVDRSLGKEVLEVGSGNPPSPPLHVSLQIEMITEYKVNYAAWRSLSHCSWLAVVDHLTQNGIISALGGDRDAAMFDDAGAVFTVFTVTRNSKSTGAQEIPLRRTVRALGCGCAR